MKYKVELTWIPSRGEMEITEVVTADNELEAQEVAVQTAGACCDPDNLGTWRVDSIELVEETNETGTYQPYSASPEAGERSTYYSPYVVSLPSDDPADALYPDYGYTSYANFDGDGYVVLLVEDGAEDGSGEVESQIDSYTPYVKSSTQVQKSKEYVPYGSTASSSERRELDANQIAGYTTVEAPPQFKASCSYHKTLANGYLPYRSSWIVAVKPGQIIKA